MKKPTIKELQLQIEHTQRTCASYYERFTAAELELKKQRESNLLSLNSRYEREREKSELLFEIVRWLINPDTTKDPFTTQHQQP